jgi:quinoprotein glucose dehydrogenase
VLPRLRGTLTHLTAAAVATLGCLVAAQHGGGGAGEWRTYAGTNANQKYSPADQIGAHNVGQLRIAWRQSAMPDEVRRGRGALIVPTNHQVTPIMIGGMLYASAGDGSVVAMHPATGVVQWVYVPDEFRSKAAGARDQIDTVAARGRSANRGVAFWGNGDNARVIAIVADSLVALHARTGALVTAFGRGGRVTLTDGYRRRAATFRWTGVPIVVNDLVVVGLRRRTGAWRVRRRHLAARLVCLLGRERRVGISRCGR